MKVFFKMWDAVHSEEFNIARHEDINELYYWTVTAGDKNSPKTGRIIDVVYRVNYPKKQILTLQGRFVCGFCCRERVTGTTLSLNNLSNIRDKRKRSRSGTIVWNFNELEVTEIRLQRQCYGCRTHHQIYFLSTIPTEIIDDNMIIIDTDCYSTEFIS